MTKTGEERNACPERSEIGREVRAELSDPCPRPCEKGCFSMPGSFPDVKVEKPRLLLHSCCGPCSTAVVERLSPTYRITVFFYNPNIHDAAEYEKRKAAQIDFLNQLNESGIYEDRIEFLEGEYDPELFFEVCRGLEGEKEGGARCEKCFRLRLERTAVAARTHGFDTFATTLTVSPYKNYKTITEIGKLLSFRYGLGYLDMDFKKKDGYRRSVELSKSYGLYRQHYCGCVFSMPKTEEKEEDGQQAYSRK